MSRPLVLWASGGAAILLAAALVGVLWSQGNADSIEPATNVSVHGETDGIANAARLKKEDEFKPPSLPPKVVLAAEATSATEPFATEVAALGTETPEADGELPVTPPQAGDKQVAEGSAHAGFDPLDFDAAGPNRDIPIGSHKSEEQPHAPAANAELPASQAAVRLGPTSTGAVRARDVAAQLALPIDSIDLPQTPLTRLLDMLSDMAAVPITLDPDALAMAGLSPRVAVDVRARDTAIGTLLADVLAELGLAYEARDGQIVVVRPKADQRRSADYEVKDLVDPSDADAISVSQLVEQFVAPATWQTGGGKGTIAVDGTTLRIEQTGRVHHQVLVFCERLRLARGLATRSRYPAERLTIDPLDTQLEPVLAKKTTFTYLPWTRLADVFRYWQEAMAVTVLVDWPALAELELSPSTPVACSIADRTWAEGLDAILDPLGLAWQAIDGQTIQITSGDALARSRTIEFYPVGKDVLDRYANPAALVDAIQRALESQIATSSSRIEFDRPSGRLIVRGTTDFQRHVRWKLDGL